MKNISIAAIFALLAQAALAGPPGSKGIPALPVTPPRAIDESNHDRSCPPGFHFAGKECAKVVTAEPDVRCPKGTTRDNDQCAKFVGKIIECPDGFKKNQKGQCARQDTAEPSYVCPEEYAPTPDGRNCIRQVPLGPKQYCPAGTITKGDSCVREVEVPFELVCPPGSVLEGKRCKREEVYDCTPARVPINDKGKGKSSGYSGHHLRNLGAKASYVKDKAPKKAVTYHVPTGKAHPERNDEYVLQKTCKRVHTEDARKVCSKGGFLKGKICIAEEAFPILERPGGFRDELVPSKLVCPEGFGTPAQGNNYWGHGKKGGAVVCVATEEVAPVAFCPVGTIDIGKKCAEYRSLILVCPHGYVLEKGVCTKTVYAPAIVEFTVKYKCSGKDCDNQAGHSKGKGHH